MTDTGLRYRDGASCPDCGLTQGSQTGYPCPTCGGRGVRKEDFVTEYDNPQWLRKVIRDLLQYPQRPEAIQNATRAVGIKDMGEPPLPLIAGCAVAPSALPRPSVRDDAGGERKTPEERLANFRLLAEFFASEDNYRPPEGEPDKPCAVMRLGQKLAQDALDEDARDDPQREDER